MTKIYNQSKHKQKRRYLRNNSTNAETLLWEHLRNRKMMDLRFLRQYSVGIFVIDFYCPKIKFAIEVDGVTHSTDDQITYDKERQNIIEEYKINFLRITNKEIYSDIIKVLFKIRERIIQLLNNKLIT